MSFIAKERVNMTQCLKKKKKKRRISILMTVNTLHKAQTPILKTAVSQSKEAQITSSLKI